MTTDPNETFVNKRYRLIKQIGEGGMGIVYQALDRLTGGDVALKRVALPDREKIGLSTSDANDIRRTLVQEFKILASIRHPYIINVLDYGFDSNRQPFFTMELLEDTQTLVAACQKRPLEVKIRLIVQMLQALAYLHRRGIVHRDLKPDNVLVVGDMVKVLDFGLAQKVDLDAVSDEVAGTMAYIAPEVLMGGGANEASDIYAAGVLIYEIFAGRLPFIADTFDQLMQTILSLPPDLTPLSHMPELAGIVERMLTKDLEIRIVDANDLVKQFNALAGVPLNTDSNSVRESYLQAASFVGREQAFARLNSALEAANTGRGSAWLIGGESGVGKSRLLDELQTQSLVSGALVLRGQAIAEGGAPYQVWLNVLRRLALQTTLSDLETSILKPIIPDVGRLVERAVQNPPEIEAEASQNRLLNVIEIMFRRQSEPMVLFLEDLHWASESLVVLKRINRIVGQIPLLIVASYRDDERPGLPNELPDMQHIKLERLDSAGIAELTRSMLGARGQDQHIVNLLRNETEGNILFIIEVVRALADSAGQLELITEKTLPRSALTGGIQAIMKRRLERTPVQARALLELAAVAGREVDLKILAKAMPGTDLEQWLVDVSTVIEAQGDRTLFAHDKLREVILNTLPSDRRAALHRQIAEAILTAYGDEPAQYAVLAYHWDKAAESGAPAAIEQAVNYLEKAGELLFEQNAYEQATELTNRLLALVETQHLTPAPLRQAKWYDVLATAALLMGRLASADDYILKAAKFCGFALPQSSLAVTVGIARQLLRQAGHRVLPGILLRGQGTPAQRERLLVASSIYETASTLQYGMFKQLPSLYSTLRLVNLNEQINTPEKLIPAYGLMCTVTGQLHMTGLAESYYRRGLAIARKTQAPSSVGLFLFLTGIYHTAAGQFETARTDLSEAARTYEQLGNLVSWAYTLTTLASTYSTQGDYEHAFDILGSVVTRTANARILNSQVVALAFQGRCEVLRGNLDSALDKLQQSLALLTEQGDDPRIGYNAWAFLAECHLRRHDLTEALEAANTAEAMVQATRTTANLGYTAFAAIANVYLSLLEASTANLSNRAGLLNKAKRIVKAMQVFPTPTGQPSAHLYAGRLANVLGDQSKALTLWRKSIQAAQRINMPYEEALAHYEIGRNPKSSDGERKIHLEQAVRSFEQVGAAHELRLARAEIK